ncbi:MAG: MATE family efflux transporter [Bacteroidia bacterium]
MLRSTLLQGPILPYLLRHSLMLFAGMLALSSLSLIDVYFIGRLGREPLAAVGFTTPVFLIGLNILLSLGTGITAVLSQAIGRGEAAAVAQIGRSGIGISLAAGAALGVLGAALHGPVFRLMGADAQVLALVSGYMYLLYPAFGVMGGLAGLFSVMRAHGESRLPMLAMILIVLANALLDPLLIGGWGAIPALGLPGAALATLVSLVLGGLVLVAGGRRYLPARGVSVRGWQPILQIALPVGFTRVLFPVASTAVVGLLSGYGPAVVAAYGMGFRLDITLLMYMVALSSVVSPFVGQHDGAGDQGRLRQGLRDGALLVVAYGLLAAAAVMMGRKALGQLFTSDAAVLAQVSAYCLVVPWGYAFNGLLGLAAGALYALSRPRHAAWGLTAHLLLIYLPLAALGHVYGTAAAVWLAYPVSLVLGSALLWSLLGQVLRARGKG